jgi:hypothetical protein
MSNPFSMKTINFWQWNHTAIIICQTKPQKSLLLVNKSLSTDIKQYQKLFDIFYKYIISCHSIHRFSINIINFHLTKDFQQSYSFHKWEVSIFALHFVDGNSMATSWPTLWTHLRRQKTLLKLNFVSVWNCKIC